MITKKDIDTFYKQYKKNIKTTQEVELILLKKEQDEHHWITLLKEKSALIRSLYRQNENALNRIIRPLINREIPLNDEIASALLSNITVFLRSAFFDSLVTLDVLELLLPFYEKREDINSCIVCYFYLAITEDALHYLNHLENAVVYNNKVIEYLPYYKSISNPFIHFLIATSFFNRIVSASTQDNVDLERLSCFLEEALSFYRNEEIRSLSPDFPYETYTNWCITIFCSCVLLEQKGNGICSDHIFQKACENIIYLKKIEQKNHDLVYEEDITIFTAYQKYLLYKGILSIEEYFDSLYDFYKHLSFNVDYQNPSFADEPPFEALRILIPELRRYIDFTSHSKDTVSKMIHTFARDAIELSIQTPQTYRVYAVNYFIFYALQSLFSHPSLKEEAIPALYKIAVNQQITTSIHTAMVEKIAYILFEHIIKNAPELFIGSLGTGSIQEVLLKKKELWEYLRFASACHDIGKGAVAEFINLQTRRITAKEFELIKIHPAIGASILEQIPSLEKYKDVSLLHHLYYDRSRGYPEDAKKLFTPYQFFIDLITVADCVDAATDLLSRNYSAGKTFEQVLRELIDGKYTRYSGRIIASFENDPECIALLKDTATNGRTEIYYQVYQQIKADHYDS